MLAAISDGLYYANDNERVTAAADCITEAKAFEAECLEPPPPGPSVVSPPPTRVAIPVREKFRGANLVVVETLDESPRRFTLRVGGSSFPPGASATVTEFWRDAGSQTLVKELTVGSATLQFDRSGLLLARLSEAELEHFANTLGSSDAPIRGLREAGVDAIPVLERLLRNANASAEQKRIALVLLGEVRKTKGSVGDDAPGR